MLTEEKLNVLNRYKNPNIVELEQISELTGLTMDSVVEYYVNNLSQVGDVYEGEGFNYN